jgi:uncharacterized protein YkvS
LKGILVKYSGSIDKWNEPTHNQGLTKVSNFSDLALPELVVTGYPQKRALDPGFCEE